MLLWLLLLLVFVLYNVLVIVVEVVWGTKIFETRQQTLAAWAELNGKSKRSELNIDFTSPWLQLVTSYLGYPPDIPNDIFSNIQPGTIDLRSSEVPRKWLLIGIYAHPSCKQSLNII